MRGASPLQQHHIEAMIGEKAGLPAAQRNLLRDLRVLLNTAVKVKMRRDNPALGIELDRIETSGYHSWTEEELQQYEAHYPVGTKGRLALDLLALHGAAAHRCCRARPAQHARRAL